MCAMFSGSVAVVSLMKIFLFLSLQMDWNFHLMNSRAAAGSLPPLYVGKQTERSTFCTCSVKRSILLRNRMIGFSGYRRLHAMSKRLSDSLRRFCLTSSRSTWLYSISEQTKMTAVISPVRFHFGRSMRCPPTSMTRNLALLAWKSSVSMVRVGSRTLRISSLAGLKDGSAIFSTRSRKKMALSSRSSRLVVPSSECCRHSRISGCFHSAAMSAASAGVSVVSDMVPETAASTLSSRALSSASNASNPALYCCSLSSTSRINSTFIERTGERRIAGSHCGALSAKPVPCKIWICLKMVVLPHSPPPSRTSCLAGSGF
mmetsp:Transcript_38334/g.65751  ORF Transcript_38334/g.65751 Transcript_38334/m.65751 type:complete len:317 (-) Transcript_38334:93-1043(-)